MMSVTRWSIRSLMASPEDGSLVVDSRAGDATRRRAQAFVARGRVELARQGPGVTLNVRTFPPGNVEPRALYG